MPPKSWNAGPFVKFGGLKFLEATHVKDVVAMLRFAENPRDEDAGFRILQLLPGVGPKTARRSLNALTRRARRSISLPPSCATSGLPATEWTVHRWP